MVIAVQSQGNTSASIIDERFGRCPFFIFYETETQKYTEFKNEYKDGGGAGIKVGRFIAEKSDTLIGLNIGPNAFTTLNAGSIAVYKGIKGKSISENIRMFLDDKLEKIHDANAEKHSGL